MQIRERGKKVVCIKTEYVPEKKRTYGKVVASQDKDLSTVSNDVCQQLNKEEVDELQKWLDDRQKKESVDRLKRSLSIVSHTVNRSAEALESDLDTLNEKQAAELWASISRLQKALKKSGHPRPRQQKRQPAERAVDNQQADIFQPGE